VTADAVEPVREIVTVVVLPSFTMTFDAAMASVGVVVVVVGEVVVVVVEPVLPVEPVLVVGGAVVTPGSLIASVRTLEASA
jgi:membrane protein DedA with SNARE-associated domain